MKVGIYILAKELDNVDEVVGRCYTELTISWDLGTVSY